MSMSKIELWESLIVAQIVVKCGDTDRQTDRRAGIRTDGRSKMCLLYRLVRNLSTEKKPSKPQYLNDDQ